MLEFIGCTLGSHYICEVALDELDSRITLPQGTTNTTLPFLLRSYILIMASGKYVNRLNSMQKELRSDL